MVERVILTAKSLDEVECILQESGFQTRRTSFSKEDTHKIEAQLIKLGKNPEHQHNYDEIHARARHTEANARYLLPAIEPQLITLVYGTHKVKIHYTDNTSENNEQVNNLYTELLARLPKATILGTASLAPLKRPLNLMKSGKKLCRPKVSLRLLRKLDAGNR